MYKFKTWAAEVFWTWLEIFIEFLYLAFISLPFASIYAALVVVYYVLPPWTIWVAIVLCAGLGLIFSEKIKLKTQQTVDGLRKKFKQ